MSQQASGKRIASGRPGPLRFKEIPVETNLTPEKILGACFHDNKIEFLIKWKEGGRNLVPAAEANVKYPDIVIKFYEERLHWDDVLE